jgi:transposase
MAYKHGDRYSRTLFPLSIEEYVNDSDPVRVYDAFVEELNVEALGLTLNEDRVGAPPYSPLSMLKLLVYGYSYGIRSSRKLERACHHNVTFIWLVGGLKPDHKTIAEFRRKNHKVLTNVLNQCARLCLKLGLIKGNVLFLDGSKFRANASLSNKWTPERCGKYLEKLDARIEELLQECDQVDLAEAESPSLVKLEKELVGKEKLHKKVRSILAELESGNLKSLNTTDKDSVASKSRQGSHSCHNAQIVTDGKYGLIVNSEVVKQSNDTNQFSTQIQEAESVLGVQAEIACADSGYGQVNDLEKISSRGTEVIVPSKKQAKNKKLSKFDKDHFKYDAQRDEYICPEGKRLKFSRISEKDNARQYRMTPCKNCKNCEHFGTCTKDKRGRTISRLFNEELKIELEQKYASEEGQKIYSLRKQKAELPFGYMKRDLGAGHFLLRGIELVNAELALLANSFNIKRMINLIGIPQLLLLLGGT